MRLMVLIVSLVTCTAWGAEPACKQEGEQVVCSKEGFKTLTDIAIDARAEAAKCNLRLVPAEARVTALEHELSLRPKPGEPAPVSVVQPSKLRPMLGVVAAIVGAAAVTAAATVDMDPANRAGVGLTGLLALSASFIIIAVP